MNKSPVEMREISPVFLWRYATFLSRFAQAAADFYFQ